VWKAEHRFFPTLQIGGSQDNNRRGDGTMKKKMWAYMLKLSTNMWGDPGSSLRYAPYSEKLVTDDEVWKQVIDFLPTQGFNTVLIDVGDAIQYESHPEVSIAGAWSKDKMKRQLDYMRSIGLTPIPKLNFSTGHDAWLKDYSRMVSTPIYYQVCEDIIKEVAEVFGYPEYIHLGMDEEDPRNQAFYSYCCVRQGELWWHDLFFFFNVCDKVGARPWVWADACWHKKEEYFKRMPKSALQSNWGYDAVHKNPDGTYQERHYQAYVKLEEAGFDQVPTSSTWDKCWFNSLEVMEISKEHIAPERLIGHMTAPWMYTVPHNLYALLNDAMQFGYAKNLIYPDCK
jgi:hypothetical protein